MNLTTWIPRVLSRSYNSTGLFSLWSQCRPCITSSNGPHSRLWSAQKLKPITMLKILIPTLLLIPITWFTPTKWTWKTPTMHSLLIAALSLVWIKKPWDTGWAHLSLLTATDSLSSPLLVLSCWLLPLMIIASQNHIMSEPLYRQRLYISLIISLQLFLILAFSATEVIMFYVMFEATLIPTLFLITRWGNQTL